MADDVASWRAATAADLDAVERIGNAAHVTLQERAEVFANKLALFPQGCFVLARNGALTGYGIAHPWALGSVPALDTVMAALPAAPTCLYIHDVVVLEAARGQGAAGVLVDVFEAVARQHALASLALVSVYGTYVFWERYGFQTAPDPDLAAKLKSYGETARYMCKDL
ncbi:MAG: GNAT family N-acetyltransferase [Xanthobacteraceae bacterium]|nr:GNAT family N-acetyltransferase [Xanthobacteraceae bacterium]